MGKHHADINEVQPRSFKEESLMEAAAFERDVIAALDLAMYTLTDAGNALSQYPGYGLEAKRIHDEASRVEDLRYELDGGDEAA